MFAELYVDIHSFRHHHTVLLLHRRRIVVVHLGGWIGIPIEASIATEHCLFDDSGIGGDTGNWIDIRVVWKADNSRMYTGDVFVRIGMYHWHPTNVHKEFPIVATVSEQTQVGIDVDDSVDWHDSGSNDPGDCVAVDMDVAWSTNSRLEIDTWRRALRVHRLGIGRTSDRDDILLPGSWLFGRVVDSGIVDISGIVVDAIILSRMQSALCCFVECDGSVRSDNSSVLCG